MKLLDDDMAEIYRLDIGQARFPTDEDVREDILENAGFATHILYIAISIAILTIHRRLFSKFALSMTMYKICYILLYFVFVCKFPASF